MACGGQRQVPASHRNCAISLIFHPNFEVPPVEFVLFSDYSQIPVGCQAYTHRLQPAIKRPVLTPDFISRLIFNPDIRRKGVTCLTAAIVPPPPAED